MPTEIQTAALPPQECQGPSEAMQRCRELIARAEKEFLGIAPFLRASIAGDDLQQVALALIEKAGSEHASAELWMNLSTALLAIGQHETGLKVQEEALKMQRTFRLPAARQPAQFRLLMPMAPGGIDENTPLDCLLQDCGVDLILHYGTAEAPLPADVPEHNAVFVAVSDTEANRPLLDALAPLLKDWGKPVINDPAQIPNTERQAASQLLQGVPGLQMPATHKVARATLERVAEGTAQLDGAIEGGSFPIILRPVGSHAGKDLARIDDIEALGRYLAEVPAESFYLARFIDYSGEDGLFRKCRVALIQGRPYASHMAVSAHWMIHYVNAGMYEDAAKRAEEAAFMADFDHFAKRHAGALEAIYRRSGLDYLCIDCAETRAGELLIFEIDHAMVVHAMDPVALFPYKQIHMQKVRDAFVDFLLALRSMPRSPSR